MKHDFIPGPWEAGIGDNDGRDFIMIEHEGFPICEVRGTDDMSCIDEEDEPEIAMQMVATARLICTAPELLLALEIALPVLHEFSSKAHRIAEEAIKKATQ